MIEQQGQVVAVANGRVSVRLGGKSGCSACDAGKGCGAGVFGRLLQRKPVILDFESEIDASRGQAVLLGLPEALFLRLLSRFYLYPLLAGMLGAVAGHGLAQVLEFGRAGSDALTLLAAIVCAALVFRHIRVASMEFPATEAVHLLRVLNTQSIEN